MAKGSGNTRSTGIQNSVDAYIQAYTAKGGPDYSLVSSGDTEKNREKFINWLDSAPKVNGDTIYRGSQILSGDILYNLIYGGWKENETIVDSSYISNNSAGILSFTRNKESVFSYAGSKPRPNPKYDRFENELAHVKFTVKTSGEHFVDISKKSHYPDEREVVAKSNTKFIYMGKQFHQVGQWWEIFLKEK